MVCDAVAAFWKFRLLLYIITILTVPPQRLNVNSLLAVLFKDVMQKRERKEIQKITLAKGKVAAVLIGMPIPPPSSINHSPASVVLWREKKGGCQSKPKRAEMAEEGGASSTSSSPPFSPFLSASAATSGVSSLDFSSTRRVRV